MKKLIALSLSLLMLLGTTAVAFAEPPAEEWAYPTMLSFTLPAGTEVTGQFTATVTVTRNQEPVAEEQVYPILQDESGNPIYIVEEFISLHKGDAIAVTTTNPQGYTGTATFIPTDVPDSITIVSIRLTKPNTPNNPGDNFDNFIIYDPSPGIFEREWDSTKVPTPPGLSFDTETGAIFSGVVVGKASRNANGELADDLKGEMLFNPAPPAAPYYTFTGGSRYYGETVTLTPEYLKTLAPGEYFIKLRFTDGETRPITFRVLGVISMTTDTANSSVVANPGITVKPNTPATLTPPAAADRPDTVAQGQTLPASQYTRQA